MSFLATKILNISKIFSESSGVPVRHYAARKGTRARKDKLLRKKKAAKEEKPKPVFIPHNLRDREKLLALRPKRTFDDSTKTLPIDNVYHVKFFKMINYPFQEAVQCHKETHHPDIYNMPNASLHVSIELNMQGEKQTKFVDDFSRIVAIPHKFNHGEERSIIVFGKSPESQKEALDAGANLAGGSELIKQIQNGAVSLQDFQFVIAHPDILPELVSLRGLMKKRFPNPRNGTLDVDVGSMVARYLHGISYTAKKDEYEKNFGLIETILGTLNMEAEELEENFAALIRDLDTMKPKRPGHFISRCLLWSLPSREKLKVDYERYLAPKIKDREEDEVDDEVGERVTL